MQRNFNFVIPGDLDALLKAESERTGAPMSEIVRRSIGEYLARSKRRVLRPVADGRDQDRLYEVDQAEDVQPVELLRG